MDEPRIPNQAPVHPLVKLAAIAVETFVREHRIIAPPRPLPPDQAGPGAAFVTLIKQGALRGSLGSVRPLGPSLAAEVIGHAVGAAARDPRFSPVAPAELPDLGYVVDLIEAIEPLAALDGHDPAACGLLVRAGRKAGVALPQIAGIERADEQLALALRKAAIDPAGPYRLARLSVKRLL
ncbi:MAG TPA: AMMECR1 domain-containing protein [Herpetosiphonaceae bacterium]